MKVSKEVASYEARLADVLRTVREVVRRRFLVLAIVAAAITVAGVALTLQLSPVYQGVTRIQIDPSRNPLARSVNEAQAQLASEAIETEVSVISSLDLGRTVVKRLNLKNDPEFSAGLQERLKTERLTDAEQLDMVARSVMSHLAVAREKLTYIIVIRFTSADSDKAAKIANAFATAYLDTKVGNRIGTAERQFTWFQRRLDELAAEARGADEKVAQYQSTAGIIRGGGGVNQQNTVDQQVVPLATQLAVLQAAAADSDARLAVAQRQARSGQLDVVGINSATIVDLRRQRGDVIRNIGEIQGRYGPLHPETVQVKDQLAQIDRQLREESSRVVRSLQAEAAANTAKANTLDGKMKELEGRQNQNARAAVIAASLQRDAESKHAAYDRMAQLAFETRQASQNSISQAQVIDAAEPEQFPFWPNRPLFYLLSLLVGIGAGIATITAQELMVSGLRNVEDVEDELGIPLLGAVPKMQKMARPADLPIEKPTSQFSEALRNARASIMGVKSEASPKVIAFTSALPSEGKTTTALAMARTMAISGLRTIVVDVDVRRAQMRQIVGQTGPGPGTVEVLTGEATILEAIESTNVENLDQVVVKKPHFTSANLFGGNQMTDLLEELTKRYDVVILDLPPLIGLADGRFLAALADAVVLAIKWDATPLHAINSALGSLKGDGSNVIGAIFTMVDQRSESVGAYYYYSKAYSAYYSKED